MTTTIHLSKTFAKKLGLPTTAVKIFHDLTVDTILDFEGIEFISRAFAQEYVFQKHNSKVQITEANMSEFVRGVLDVVERDFDETCCKPL
jgi:hypothetical protein